MIALINTMGKIDGDSIGAVVSLHRTVDAALKADDKLQRNVRRNNGETSYLPTIICKLSIKYRKGEHVSPAHAEAI